MDKNNIMQNKTLKILFWNARSIRQRILDIQIASHEFDIIIVVETWLTPSDKIHLPGFSTYRKDRLHSRGGGIIIFIKNNLAYVENQNIHSPDQSVEISNVHINNILPALDIIACYRAPGTTLSQNQWDIITNNVVNTNSILLGDFNAHNKYWNCRYTDKNGERLEISADNQNLFLHNDNTNTHVDFYRGTKSNLDLVFSTLPMADKISVEVCDENWGSDHHPICINVNIEKNIYKKKTFELISLRTNWVKYSERLKTSYESFLEPNYDVLTPCEKYDHFVNIITEAIKLSTPKKKKILDRKTIKNPVPWWDSECNQVKSLRRSSFKKWEQSKSLEDLINHKKYSAIAKRTFKQKKKDYHKKFAQTIDFRTDSTYVWNKMKILKNSWNKISNSYHNTENLQMADKVNESLNKLSPPWTPTNPEWLPSQTLNEFFDCPFSFAEFNIALESKNKKSSPGMDGIDNEILQELPIKYKLLLLDIFNQMHLNSTFPSSWKHAFVHFINKSDGKSVRPITLTSCLSKLYKSLAKNRLQWYAEHYNLIPASQHGFRKGKSCTDNLVNLKLKIDEAFVEKKEVLAAFLDVKGAFDNINVDILLKKLSEIGCSNKFLKYIKFLTYERYIHTDYTGENYRKVHKGVPQGGVLSPLLYILYVSDIIKDLQKTVSIAQFADDIALYVKCNSTERGKSLIERAINIVGKNLSNIGLELAPNKTKLIHFNNKRILPGSVEIKVKDHTIKSTKSACFLGIIFDYKLSFLDQIDNISQRCAKSLNIIKFLCGTWWGADPSTLIILYKSLIRSVIDYGSFIYFPTQINLINKIENIQISALKTSLGYRRSTPNNIVLAESKVTTLKERTNYLCKRHISKIFSNQESDSYKIIKDFQDICNKKSLKFNTILF